MAHFRIENTPFKWSNNCYKIDAQILKRLHNLKTINKSIKFFINQMSLINYHHTQTATRLIQFNRFMLPFETLAKDYRLKCIDRKFLTYFTSVTLNYVMPEAIDIDQLTNVFFCFCSVWF